MNPEIRKTHRGTHFNDRVRFNWGYHDAAHDITYHNAARTLVETGPQSLAFVSKDYDPFYHAGYKYGREDAREGQYAGNSSAAWSLFKADENRHKLTIRFWEFVNDGWIKLTLCVGRQLTWCRRSATEEGWQRETRRYLYEDAIVTVEIETDGVDYDGRLKRYWKGFFHTSDVKKKRCYLGQDKAGRNIYSEDIYQPLWHKKSASQRDFAAEAAGY